MSDEVIFTIILDGTKLQSKADFFRELSQAVDFDLAANLDALDEDLCYEIPLRCGPFRIVWKNANKSDWSGYSELTEVLGVLTYQQQRLPERFVELRLEFEPEAGEDTWSYPAAYSEPYYVSERMRRLGKA